MYSHGTSEFYRARAAITKRLIEKHGFNTVAIEADWPDCRVIDHYVRRHPHRGTGVPIRVFDHFPRWMWRNTEVQEFVDWLREHNADKSPKERVSFNGLDLYSMGASTRAVVEYLERVRTSILSSVNWVGICLRSTGLDGPRPRKSRQEAIRLSGALAGRPTGVRAGRIPRQFKQV